VQGFHQGIEGISLVRTQSESTCCHPSLLCCSSSSAAVMPHSSEIRKRPTLRSCRQACHKYSVRSLDLDSMTVQGCTFLDAGYSKLKYFLFGLAYVVVTPVGIGAHCLTDAQALQ